MTHSQVQLDVKKTSIRCSRFDPALSVGVSPLLKGLFGAGFTLQPGGKHGTAPHKKPRLRYPDYRALLYYRKQCTTDFVPIGRVVAQLGGPYFPRRSSSGSFLHVWKWAWADTTLPIKPDPQCLHTAQCPFLWAARTNCSQAESKVRPPT